MNDVHYEIKDDVLIRYQELRLDNMQGIYQMTPVIDKEAFIMCFKKWIEKGEINERIYKDRCNYGANGTS